MNLQQKFNYARNLMNSALVERQEEIDLLLTAILCKEHLFLCGSPGTAKSMAAVMVTKFIKNTKPKTIHCCKDTSRDAAFGPLDILALKEGRYDRIWNGGAADCHILIMEEVYKAGPAVLDMFLMLMNERVVEEGVNRVDAPLLTILGLGNEWTPEGYESGLAAFSDRFLFRSYVEKVSEKGEDELLERAERNELVMPNFKETITVKELETAQDDVRELPISVDAKTAFKSIRTELNNKKVNYGNRRLTKSWNACRAYAYLLGDSEVQPVHLEILSYVLWDDPGEQRIECGKVVRRLANPVKVKITELMVEARDAVVKMNDPKELVDALNVIQNTLNTIQKTPLREEALQYVAEELSRARLRTLPQFKVK